MTELVDQRYPGQARSANSATALSSARVAPLTAAARAGLQAGDVVTLFGDVAAPGPRQILRAWASAPGGRPLVVAVTRNGTHLMLAVER